MAASISIEHVLTENDLPENLVVGRLYFIDDTGIIRVNHGGNVVDYGGNINNDALTAIYARIDTLYSLQAAQWQMNYALLSTISQTLTDIKELIEDGDFYVNASGSSQNEAVEQMIEDVFSDDETYEDLPNDDVTQMLDDVFNDNEQLNDGDVDDGFITMLDEVFN